MAASVPDAPVVSIVRVSESDLQMFSDLQLRHLTFRKEFQYVSIVRRSETYSEI